jgi:hypothetical protein
MVPPSPGDEQVVTELGQTGDFVLFAVTPPRRSTPAESAARRSRRRWTWRGDWQDSALKLPFGW